MSYEPLPLQPRCSRCLRDRKDCTFETLYRFRRSSIQGQFTESQPWMTISSKIRFFDESEEIRAQYGAEYSHKRSATSPQDLSPNYMHSDVDQVQTPPTSIDHSEGLSVLSLINAEPQSQENQIHPSRYTIRSPSPRESPHAFVYQQPPGAPVLWPLEQEQDAMLLRHYLDHVALFFDMIDDERHFGNHIVQRAKKNSTLMNAILALSARHLSRTSSFDSYVADHYYQRCFETLIPELDDNVAIRDESLLAATIILRLLEEMNISITGNDPQGHLFGTQAIILSAEQQYAATLGPSFRQAIYWAAFRQELWMSLMTQLPFKLHIFPADRSLDPATDSIWATRTIAHLGEVCNFAFGDERHSVERHGQLINENQTWTLRRPESFDPFFSRRDSEGSGKRFPDIRFHEKSHVMGKQYNTLAHVLLVANDPTIPRLGPSHKQARQAADKIIQDDVRTLCGVAMSNSQVFPAKFVACYAITLVGDRFANRSDQESLHNMLVNTEKQHGFPPTANKHHLEEAWGWDSESMS